MGPVSLLTAIDSTSHIHLIIGSNPLAAARCAKSLEVGAIPRLIAPESAELHYALQKRIDSGEVEWLKKNFEDEDVLRLGREEINGIVDAVFVTSGPRDPLSMNPYTEEKINTNIFQVHISRSFVDETAYQ
jgi:uroporphyrin-III C-methyltransferase